MIQAIVVIIVAIWLAWGIFNVVPGLIQILQGLACGIAAIILYSLAYLLEFVSYIVRKFVGAISILRSHFTSAAKSSSVRPSTRSKNSVS